MNIDINEIRYIKASPYISKAQIANTFGFSLRTVCNRLAEMDKYVQLGRYSEYTILTGCGYTYVNYLALIDFMRYRKDLQEGRKVPPFNPRQIAANIGWGVVQQELQ